MKSILNKIYKKIILKEENEEFKNIYNQTGVKKLFDSILEFSETSELRYVGGCVRKILCKEDVDDIDLATNLNPEEIKICLKKNNIKFYETGLKHGTITASIDNKNYEITSLRIDKRTDGRHAEVKFIDDWLIDAQRRDFSFNSIYADINGNLFDPFDGKKDLKNGKINFIGDANLRIQEDFLRILRYIRFYINYSKNKHEEDIKKIIRQNIHGVALLSKERLISELKKIFLSENFHNFYNDAFSKEIISLIFPQLKYFNIFKSSNKYVEEIFKKKDFDFMLALLTIDETDNTDFFLYKYKFSNNTKERLKFLYNIYSKPVEDNLFKKESLWKIYYKYNKQYLLDLINFSLCKSKKNNRNLIELRDYFSKKEKPIFPIKAKDIMEQYGLKESKYLGKKLREIEDFWINNGLQISNSEIKKIIHS